MLRCGIWFLWQDRRFQIDLVLDTADWWPSVRSNDEGQSNIFWRYVNKLDGVSVEILYDSRSAHSPHSVSDATR